MFVREKTNYKSILFKTFYVSGGSAGDGRPVAWHAARRCFWRRCRVHSCGQCERVLKLLLHGCVCFAACWHQLTCLPGSQPAAAARRSSAEQVMEYAVTHYDVAYVLKTDDDAFINVAPMVEQLKLLCQNPGCQK